MQLKTAASFLMIGSATLVANQLAMLFAGLFLDVKSYAGVMQVSIMGLLSASLAVVSFLFAISLRRGRHSAYRVVIAILLAVFSGTMIVSELIVTLQFFQWFDLSGSTIATIAERILYLLFSVSLMLLGIAVSGTRQLRQRRAYRWVAVCGSVAAVSHIVMWIYHFCSIFLNKPFLLLLSSSLLTVVFPIAWVFLSFTLLRRRAADPFEELEEEF
jgi:hypothetical protein